METVNFFVGYARLFSITPLDANGTPAPVDGPIRLTLYAGEDPETGEPYPVPLTIEEVTPNQFLLTATAEGTCTLTINADALIGEGYVNIMRQYELTCVPIAQTFHVAVGPLEQEPD